MQSIDDSPVIRDGNAVILAYDHGLEHGPKDFKPVPESADPDHVFDVATHDAVTCIATQKGVAEGYYPRYEDDVNLLLKLNGTSNLWEPDDYYSPKNCTVRYAVEELGASAVGYTMYAGSDHEGRMFNEFREVQEEARKYGVPVVMWAYPRGRPIKNDTKTKTIGYGARIGLELGADMVKVKYAGSRDAMEQVIDGTGDMKLVMSGGSKASDRDFLEDVHATIAAGGNGLAVGRNIFQRDDPQRMLDMLEQVIYSGKTPDQVL
ncbi:MAG: aldolase [Candidatus Nanohaloarchaea archaeon]|nr:aldolase [Candidatus Nanohaloarchaea archaeon]